MISKWNERHRSSMESENEIEVEHYIDMSESSSNDSDKDPSYGDLEGTRSKLSNLSLKNKSKAWDEVDEIDDEIEIVEAGNDEVEQKSYEEVQRLIGDGKIEKLKVEQCKIYLRKNGLRLTGNKVTLIQRINEHLEILNGGGEKKYPLRSFFVNCKGDACTGDVVLFEQNVYEMFNIASRSATGPACGTRLVAGRIVKESYGSAKQQHTFTIEVLWSKGEKPLPPLHPLLIKGRNLYRLKTLRQKWEDEGQRRKILMEKHSRGFIARCNRDARVREKENRKFLKPNRVSRKEINIYKSQADTTSRTKPSIQPQLLGVSVNVEKHVIRPQQFGSSSNLDANYGKSATEPQAQNQGFQSKKDSINDVKQASQRLVGTVDIAVRNRSYSRSDQMDQKENFHRHPKPAIELQAPNQGFQSKKVSIDDINRTSQRLVGTGDIVVRNRSRSRWDQMDKTENFHRHPKPATELQAKNLGYQSKKDLIHDITQDSQRSVGNRDITVHNRARSRWDQRDQAENFQGHPKPATEPQAQNQGFQTKKDSIDHINQTSQGLVGTRDITVGYRYRSRWDQMIPTENSHRPPNPPMAQNHEFQSKRDSIEDINQASQRLTGDTVVRHRPHSRWDQKDPFISMVRPISPTRRHYNENLHRQPVRPEPCQYNP